jgi:hypothetical protein
MIEYPNELETSIEGADWLELCCFLEYPNEITKTAVEGFLKSKDDNELLSSDIFKHIEWRKSISPNYPFVIGDTSIHSSSPVTESQEYLFPLLLATHDFYKDTQITNWSPVGDLFELYCTASIKKMIGDAALIGNNLGRLPAGLDACLTAVCNIMNESKGPPHARATTFQDAGVDIIGWKKIDKRKGQVVFLVQCASGKNWRKKGGDIKPRLWHELVFWTIDPVKVLAFPFAYDFSDSTLEDDWHFYTYDSGLLLDRLRLINFKFSEYDENTLNLTPISRWIETQLTLIKRHEVEG